MMNTRWNRRLLGNLLFAWVAAFSGLAGADDRPELSPPELAQRLKEGGYLLYFRHATTDHNKDDSHPVDFKNCATQRNLSQDGRNEARSIGEHIKRLGIPIGKVLSSPYCRCRDTARLAFGDLQVDQDLHFAITADPDEREKITRSLKLKLAKAPPTGENDVIVSHTANLREAMGIWPKPEGVAWVIEPDGQGDFKALGKIEPSDWARLK